MLECTIALSDIAQSLLETLENVLHDIHVLLSVPSNKNKTLYYEMMFSHSSNTAYNVSEI